MIRAYNLANAAAIVLAHARLACGAFADYRPAPLPTTDSPPGAHETGLSYRTGPSGLSVNTPSAGRALAIANDHGVYSRSRA